MSLKKKIENSRYVQYTAALSATLAMAACAMYQTWPSPSLPKLSSNSSQENPLDEPITTDEGSWIVSSFMLGSLPGSVLAFWVIDKYGRKRSLLFSAVPLLTGWLMVYFARSVLLISLARALAGAAMAIVVIDCSIYNGEIAEKDIRGKLGTFFNLMKLAGNFVVLSVGPFASYDVLNAVCAILPVLFFSTFVFMPESPYYLVKVGNVAEAEKELIRLSSKPNRNDKDFVRQHLHEISSTVEADMRNEASAWEFFTSVHYRKAIMITIGIKTFQQLSGSLAIEAYMQTIVQETGSSVSPEASSLLFGAVQFPAALAAAFVVDRIGRKPLWIVSCLGCAVALGAEGAYFYLQDVAGSDVSSLAWLPTTGIMVFLLMCPVGIFTLPYVWLGELFPTNIKSVAVSMASLYGGALSFGVSKSFAPLSEFWGMHSTFWLFAGVCLCGAAFVAIVLPETKGKTFAEIQKELNGKLDK